MKVQQIKAPNGKPFRIYRNLTAKGIVYSVQSYHKGKGYRVMFHVNVSDITLMMYGITSKVYEAGRQRVVREKKKYVHAYIQADMLWTYPGTATAAIHKVSFNPYKVSKFYVGDGENVYGNFASAKLGYITKNGVYVYNPVVEK